MRARALLFAAAASLAAGTLRCNVGEVDLSDHPCPCVDDTWVCAQPKNVCVRGAVTLSALQAAWTTPNSIRWTWKAEQLDQLAAYELVVGPTLDDVENRTARSLTWTGKQNPELAFSYLPRSEVADPVLQTVTDEHQPNTTYFAKLYAIDKSGAASSTAPATASTTPAAANRIVVYDDSLPPDSYTLPTSVKSTCTSPEVAFDGSRCALEFDGNCEDLPADAGAAGTTCLDNLRLSGLHVSMSTLSETDFDHLAFLEIAIAVDPPAQSFWSNVWLTFGHVDEPCTSCWDFSPWTPRADGQFRRVQVPLRAVTSFADKTRRLTHADLQSGLFQVAVGGTWVRGARVRLDEIAIRW